LTRTQNLHCLCSLVHVASNRLAFLSFTFQRSHFAVISLASKQFRISAVETSASTCETWFPVYF
jgi:hypothetical protein